LRKGETKVNDDGTADGNLSPTAFMTPQTAFVRRVLVRSNKSRPFKSVMSG
jgi:hypothetical protein